MRRFFLKPLKLCALLSVGALIGITLAEFVPLFSIGYWKLVYADTFAPGFFGSGGSTSAESLRVFQIAQTRYSGRPLLCLMYKIGNPQGQAYALYGLVAAGGLGDFREVERLRDEYVITKGTVKIHIGPEYMDETKDEAMFHIYRILYTHDPELGQKEVEELKTHFASLREKRANASQNLAAPP